MRKVEPAEFWRRLERDLDLLEGQEENSLGEEERIPCPDQSCVGSLGEDGRCRVCGIGMGDVVPGDEGELKGGMDEEEEEPCDMPERIPCPDGNCVGTIGDDGCCRICGLRVDG